MYPEYMFESIKKVERTRAKRLELARKHGKNVFPAMNSEEREKILNTYHPDYKDTARKKVRIGPNKGESITKEVVDILESYPRNRSKVFDLNKIDYDPDVLVI